MNRRTLKADAGRALPLLPIIVIEITLTEAVVIQLTIYILFLTLTDIVMDMT